jgi:hypothetical protein
MMCVGMIKCIRGEVFEGVSRNRDRRGERFCARYWTGRALGRSVHGGKSTGSRSRASPGESRHA